MTSLADPIVAVRETTSPTRQSWVVFASTMFLSACLLFQVQLIISKYILPWFGGTPSVWTTAMVFFQVLLLGGYLYAHLISTYLSARRQMTVHGGLLALSVLLLGVTARWWPAPILPGAGFKPLEVIHPTRDILVLLATSVGLPFFLLSTTGPLLQSWHARTAHSSGSTYRLYAVSNLGSLLGLVSYPFLVEPLLRLRTQGWIWAAGYAAFAVGAVLSATWAQTNSRRDAVSQAGGEIHEYQKSGGVWDYLLWGALAACSCTMLLATTNVLSQQVAAIPLLWVVPLAIYLLSFILCFESSRWYKHLVFHPMYAIGLVLVLFVVDRKGDLLVKAVGLAVALFSVCMVCHGELARSKPEPRRLTSFYLAISAGGAVGGLFVAIIAPRLFSNYWELQLAHFGAGVLLLAILLRDRNSWLYKIPVPLSCAGAVVAGLAFYEQTRYDSVTAKLTSTVHFFVAFASVSLLLFGLSLLRRNHHNEIVRLTQAWVIVLFVLAGTIHVLIARTVQEDTEKVSRNFFGVLAVLREGDFNMLRHGGYLARLTVSRTRTSAHANDLLRTG